MPFYLGKDKVQFRFAEFESLVNSARGFTFGLKSSSMDPIRNLVRDENHGDSLRQLVKLLDPVKAAKYAKPLKYLIFRYPEIIPAADITLVGNPKTGDQNTFQNWMVLHAKMRSRLPHKPPPGVGDLIYGMSKAGKGREAKPYQKPANAKWAKLICDNFNNAAGIGSGSVYDRDPSGIGALAATPQSVLAKVKANVRKQHQGISAEAMNAYSKGLLMSRYSPDSVFGLSEDKLTKDTNVGAETMRGGMGLQSGVLERLGLKSSPVEQHIWMHARYIRGLRRACKNGVAMVATSSLYCGSGAQVFFVLDDLGDLGKVALKVNLPDGDYVPITSSELTFCFRYWDHSQVPLRNYVRFFVNGNEVIPPWDGDWTEKDAGGNVVYSNQEAWLRYKLYRSVVKPVEKAFPRQASDDDVDWGWV